MKTQKSTSPKISICTPVFQVEKYIEKCARSLFEQTYQNVEYIFVDDCGSDKSIEILEMIISEYPGKDIRILHHTHNRGVAAARNTAVSAVDGEFLMHVDSDDWLEPNAVEVLVARQIETNADIVSGNALVHSTDQEKELIEPDFISVEDMLTHIVNYTAGAYLWKRIIRKDLYKEHDIRAVEGVNFGEDYHILPRLLYYTKAIAKVNVVVYHYNCQNNDSYTRLFFAYPTINNYRNNRDSQNVLLDFFADKSKSLVETLRACKVDNCNIFLWGALKYGDRKVFDELCREILSEKRWPVEERTFEKIRHISKHYRYYWLLVRWRILLRKITGKRNYNLFN